MWLLVHIILHIFLFMFLIGMTITCGWLMRLWTEEGRYMLFETANDTLIWFGMWCFAGMSTLYIIACAILWSVWASMFGYY